MTELERELLEALKRLVDAQITYVGSHITVAAASHIDAIRIVREAREVAARAEAKAKEPVCKCDPDSWTSEPNGICGSFHDDGLDLCTNCEHDRACHIVGGRG